VRIDRIEDLPKEPARAVIINVGTELVTSLALASTRANCSLPILLINCDPTRASSAHFTNLMMRWQFDLLDAPRRIHGKVLDDLFRRIRSECVLLVDSDLELRDPDLVTRMHEYFEAPRVFGAGFINGPGWLVDLLGCTPKTALYHERPWIPCVMFRTSHIREALSHGLSFKSRTIYNDIMFSGRASRLLAKRFQNAFVPSSRIIEHMPAGLRTRMREYRLSWLRWARRDFYGLRPNYVFCDTGTDVYQWCKYEKERLFAGIPVELMKDEVVHYGGVTRLEFDPHQPQAVSLTEVEDEVRGRLRDVYGLEIGEEWIRSSLKGWTPATAPSGDRRRNRDA
jgi:hypothetical protein